jgi:ABC-type siderophore export system fused ATPase/permease subunit
MNFLILSNSSRLAHIFRPWVFVMEKLKELPKSGKIIVILNHDHRFNEYANRAVEVKNGIVNELILVQ